MKKMLNAALTAAFCLASCFTLPGGPAGAADPAGGTPGAQAAEAAVTVTYAVTNRKEAMLLEPEANCDPDMLIPVTPDCDPGFMRELGAEEQVIYVTFDQK